MKPIRFMRGGVLLMEVQTPDDFEIDGDFEPKSPQKFAHTTIKKSSCVYKYKIHN